MRKISILCIILLSLSIASCEVEFSPNAAWKEVPVVYCILDQDDDTTWARVEKCFLGEDNITHYGQISDSINYPIGSINVSLLAYDQGGAQVDSLAFHVKNIQHDSGAFANNSQPAYYAITTGRLKDNRTYRIRVQHADDGKIIAESDPVSLIVKTAEQVYSVPAIPYGKFGFGTQGYFKMEWPALQNARLYTPIVRFFYERAGDTTYLDFPCGSTRNYSYNYARDLFLKELKTHFQDDTTTKNYVRTADIFLTACSEEVYAYMNTSTASSDLSETHATYTNINGGIGILGSRRTHLYKTVAVDEGIEPNRGLAWFIHQLEINMY